MKTSTIIMSLLLINSGVLASQLFTLLFTNISLIIFGALELILGLGYASFKIVKSIRNAFDVDFSF